SMQGLENPGQRFAPGVEPGVGIAGAVRTRDVRRHTRLAAEMQPRYARRYLGGRSVMVGYVVDEHRAAGRIFLDDPLQRGPFGPLVGEYPRIDAVFEELTRAAELIAILEVGQDDHVRFAGELGQRRRSAFDRRLAVHLGIEKLSQV